MSGAIVCPVPSWTWPEEIYKVVFNWLSHIYIAYIYTRQSVLAPVGK